MTQIARLSPSAGARSHDWRQEVSWIWTIGKTRTVVEARPISTTCMASKPVACDPSGKWRTGGDCPFVCAGMADRARVYIEADPSVALPLAVAAGLSNVSLVQQDDGSGKGLSVYAIDLAR